MPRVLLVEDDADIAAALGEAIAAAGMIAMVATDIPSAVERLHTDRADVLVAHGFYAGAGSVVGNYLGHGTCFHLMDRVRADGWVGPAILVSGKPLNDAERARCGAVGFVEVAFKPVKCAALEALVRRAIAGSRENLPVVRE